MTLGQFRTLFEAAEKLYLESGNAPVAQALREMSGLFAGYEEMTVANFSKKLAKIDLAPEGTR